MLWEGEFYESGQTISQRIAELVPQVQPEVVADIAVEARNQMKLRHVPLLIAREMARYDTHNFLVRAVLEEIIQRPDELTEFLAIYWKDGKQPIAKQVRLGLADAFKKFSEYQLAKYNRDGPIKLRDVLFLTHPKPIDVYQQQVWDRLVDGTLAIPNTWENRLSAGEDKREAFTTMLTEGTLGAMALLRNLRNMTEAGVDKRLIKASLRETKADKVLPFRFISAARYAPDFIVELEDIMLRCLDGMYKLAGSTVLLVDVSGSMEAHVSGRSEISRMDAGIGLAIMLRELCEYLTIATFSGNVVQLAPDLRGFRLGDAIMKSQPHGSTYLGRAVKAVTDGYAVGEVNRLIVISDEQSHDPVPTNLNGISQAYMINVASNKNGLGYNGDWSHIDGWSEATVDYIHQYENTPW
jgi:hypothetical protein